MEIFLILLAIRGFANTHIFYLSLYTHTKWIRKDLRWIYLHMLFLFQHFMMRFMIWFCPYHPAKTAQPDFVSYESLRQLNEIVSRTFFPLWLLWFSNSDAGTFFWRCIWWWWWWWERCLFLHLFYIFPGIRNSWFPGRFIPTELFLWKKQTKQNRKNYFKQNFIIF
jgi:hypothetical protein